jgi:hypothetical protein
MAIQKVFQRSIYIVMLALPSLCYGVPQPALVVWDGTAGLDTSVLGNLTTQLTTAGFTVTPNVGVPAGSLAAYKEIWDVRYNNTTPLTASDITAYVGYLAGGGALFVMGENTGFITRDNSMISLVQSAGGGTITVVAGNDSQTVEAPFTGPNPVTAITYLADAGVPAPPGTGAYLTEDSTHIGEVIFGPGTLSNAAAGSLAIIFDVNFLDPGSGYTQPGAVPFVANLIAYLAAPVRIGGPPPPATPAPRSSILMLIGLAGLGLFEVRRRMRCREA